MKGIISLSIFLILLSSLVIAEPDIIINTYKVGYTLEPYNVAETICNCQILNDQYLLKNTAAITQAFSITVSNGLTLNQDLVTLKPGQQTIIATVAPLICNAKDFSYDIKVVSSLGEQKSLTRFVETTTCQNLNLALFPEGNITPDSNVSFVLQLNNLGPFTETYLVTAESLEEYVDDEAYQLTLNGFQAHNITFNYDFPPGLWGNHSMIFKARATNNKLTAEVVQKINIARDYDFTVQTEEQTVCTELDNEITFNITNNGAVLNYYSFNIVGNPSYQINQTQIGLEPGETKTVSIKPNKDSPLQDNIILQVKTSYGSIQTEIIIPVNVINCYDLQITVPQSITQCNEEARYPVVLKNNGILDEEITSYVYGNVTLSDETIKLMPNESKNLFLQINPQESLDETIILNITGSNGIHKIYNIPLRAATLYECYFPKISKTNFDTTKQQFNSKIIVLNTGEKDANYTLTIDNNAKINAELFVKSKESNQAYLEVDFSDRNYGTYGFTLLLETQGQSYENIISVDFKQRNLFQKSLDYLNANYCLWIMIVILILILLAIITLIFIPKSVFSNFWFKIGVIIVILLIILGFFATMYLKGLPQPIAPKLENDLNELHYRGYVGEEFTFNLDKFFYDIDGDKLIYNISGDNINYLLINDTVTFSGLEAGNYLVYFIATDLESETRSPPVTMEVKNKPSITFSQFMLGYCSWINYSLFVILLLIIVLILIKGKTRFITTSKKETVETKKPITKKVESGKKKTNKKSRKRK